MKTIPKDKVIYHFSPLNPPAAEVELGEKFMVECEDCYCGQIKSAADLRPNIDISIMDASTGPISVKDVQKGNVICVHIHEINFNPQAVMVTSVGLGPLGDLINEPNTRVINIKDGEAVFSEKISFPLTPMIGVLGVAPADGEIHCATPGDHGANMDTKDLKPGNKVYFPVFVDGANIALGDLHACMGDGELSGTGIEASGNVVLSVTKAGHLPISMPLIEAPDFFAVAASEADFRKTYRKALIETTNLIMAALDVDFPDAYRIMSATCDLRVSQIVNSVITLRVCIPRSILLPLF